MLVFVRDPQLPLLGLEAGLTLVGDLDLEQLAAVEPVTFRPQVAVHADGTRSKQSLRFGARADPRERGDVAVEPQVGRVVWD